ncbi:hypothetical protein [Chthonobacter rhizosphaerae]|uniref:hypothetical protein n=1 Tax=Chthonobacter rhizosphaerae TaxID=2735553 RepID=UPI0015EF712E|nr:hypothetical protein [Chthonobacter rhizosphaerae]
MPTDLTQPEDYLISFKHNGETVAVRVQGYSYADARARFLAMSPSERRAMTIGRLAPRDEDQLGRFADWIRGKARQAGFQFG